MKKALALFLALTFVCISFASCGDALDGKTFTYHKAEIEFGNEAMETLVNGLLSDGQSAAEYFMGSLGDYSKMTYSFKDGKVTISAGGQEQSASYEMKGNDVVKMAGEELPDNTRMYYEDGNLIMEQTFERQILLQDVSATLKIIFH